MLFLLLAHWSITSSANATSSTAARQQPSVEFGVPRLPRGAARRAGLRAGPIQAQNGSRRSLA